MTNKSQPITSSTNNKNNNQTDQTNKNDNQTRPQQRKPKLLPEQIERRKLLAECGEWLRQKFPKAFFDTKDHSQRSQIKPLKLGIIDDILQYVDTLDAAPYSKVKFREAVGRYVHDLQYLKVLSVVNNERIDLNGESAGVVSAEHATDAAKRYEDIEEILRNKKNRGRKRGKFGRKPSNPPKIIVRSKSNKQYNPEQSKTAK